MGDLALWRTPDLSGIERFSAENLPPTSAARTTRRARALSPLSSGYLLSFCLRAAVTPRSGSPFSCEGANQCGVHCDLRAPKEGKAINHNLQSSSVKRVEHTNVHVPDKDIGSHSTSTFSADAGCGVLQWKSPGPQNTSHRTSRPVVAKAVEKTATPARMNCERKGLTEPPQEDDAFKKTLTFLCFCACRRCS